MNGMLNDEAIYSPKSKSRLDTAHSRILWTLTKSLDLLNDTLNEIDSILQIDSTPPPLEEVLNTKPDGIIEEIMIWLERLDNRILSLNERTNKIKNSL